MQKHSSNTMIGAAACCMALASMLWVSPALASETLAEVARANEKSAVLQARLKNVELEAQIAQKRAEIEKSNASAALPPLPSPGGMIDSDAAPVVRAVEGVDGRLSVTLAYAGGVTLTLGVGDTTPEGWKIARVTANSVTLAKGKATRQLSFGSAPPPSPAASAPGSAMLPPPMYR